MRGPNSWDIHSIAEVQFPLLIDVKEALCLLVSGAEYHSFISHLRSLLMPALRFKLLMLKGSSPSLKFQSAQLAW